MRGMGLTFIPTVGTLPVLGHVIVPELNVAAHRSKKKWVEDTARELARMANDSILIRPPGA
jgi:uncharacterized protein (UPF0254 family)